jgi:hypothetical protein
MRLDFFCAPITSHVARYDSSTTRASSVVRGRGAAGLIPIPAGCQTFDAQKNVENLHILLRVSTLLFRIRYTHPCLPTCNTTLHTLDIYSIATCLSPDPICSATVHLPNPLPNSLDTPSSASQLLEQSAGAVPIPLIYLQVVVFSPLRSPSKGAAP